MSNSTTRVRCAIYARVSSDEGLGQDFNSLQAQREACEHVIASRAEQGWVGVPEVFDDGGVSGGTLERPALQRLLARLRARELDAVVVYRLDRLSRTLRDFLDLVSECDALGVSLVSTTESVDTASASGRLMLNLLLSFAQHEREVASERTKHKIAASRRQGIWTGGRPVLGYDFAGARLTVNEPEAVLVRTIFGLYLERRSLSAVMARLAADGAVNKRWTTRAGAVVGGQAFQRSGLYGLLTNALYIGRVPHGAVTYEGRHAAIVDEVVFARVQAILAENGRSGASLTRNSHGGILKALLHCRCGARMVHTATTTTKGVAYRYYRCPGHRGVGPVGARRCQGGQLPAGELEQFVLDRVKARFAEPALARLVFDLVRERAQERTRDLEAQRTLHARAVDQAGAARLKEIDADLAAARGAVPDLATVECGLRTFDATWSSCSPTERARLLGLVVRKVTFDAAKGEVTIEACAEGEGDGEGEP